MLSNQKHNTQYLPDSTSEAGNRSVAHGLMLRARNVSHIYTGTNDPIHALLDINLELRKGEILVLVGPSGCGKSTLLNCAAQLLSPSSGTVELFLSEKIAHGLKRLAAKQLVWLRRRCKTCLVPDYARSRIFGVDRLVRAFCSLLLQQLNKFNDNTKPIMVFQDDAVFPWLRVRENATYGMDLINNGAREAENRVNALLSIVGLKDFSSYWPKELSGGMRKRVELVRAYAGDSPLLIMDEPFGSLDVLTREEMQIQLLDIQQQHAKSILLSTHDIEEALFVGSRIVLMSPRPGRIIDIYDVPFAHPRIPSLKLTREFQLLRATIISALREGQSQDCTQLGAHIV